MGKVDFSYRSGGDLDCSDSRSDCHQRQVRDAHAANRESEGVELGEDLPEEDIRSQTGSQNNEDSENG